MENWSGPSNGHPLGAETNEACQGVDSLGLRLRADVNRAVGGLLNLVRELSRVSALVATEATSERIVKRIQFFTYEIRSLLPASTNLCERDRLSILNRFFFEEKGFRCLPTAEKHTPGAATIGGEAYLLNQVLANRAGAPLAIALLYAYMAEHMGVTLEFVDLYPSCFLKWNEAGRSRFIDVSRGGSTLSSDELIELLQERFSPENSTSAPSVPVTPTLLAARLGETLTFETFVADYLTQLKVALDPIPDAEHALILQNTLISYQPSNLALLGERAILHRRLGNFKSALADLKRYFAFHEREKAPKELVALHDDLLRLLDRSKSSVELLDL
jgi:regulator of sirC expression with transglutaminase-like and TPR domain